MVGVWLNPYHTPLKNINMRLLRKKGVWVYGYVRYIFLNVENRTVNVENKIPNATFRIVNR